MKINIWSIILVIGLALSTVLQIAILFGVYVKGGGTTGPDPVVPVFPFVILVLAAVFVSVWKRFAVRKVWYASALISGLLGSVLACRLELTGSLVQYERALLHGAPVLDKDKLIFPLLVFGLAEIAALTFGYYVSVREQGVAESDQHKSLG